MVVMVVVVMMMVMLARIVVRVPPEVLWPVVVLAAGAEL